MIEDPDWLWWAVAAVVAVLVAARAYAGPAWFGPGARHWQPLRRVLVPLLHRLAQAYVGEEWYAETHTAEREHVATLALDADDVLEDLAAAGYEPQPLASVATDWTGEMEAASWARYHGPKPVPGAPYWLRDRQVHVRLFERADGVAICAHEESNPWRPDLWRDHYRGETLHVERGRQLVAEDLDIRITSTAQ